MKANVLALALLSLCACDQSQTVSPDTSHVVTTPTHDCAKQRFASINANGGTFKLTGTCEAVFVNGVNNRITIEASKKVIVDGGKNVMQIIASDQVTVNGEAIPSSLRRGSLAKRPLWSRSVTTTMSSKNNEPTFAIHLGQIADPGRKKPGSAVANSGSRKGARRPSHAAERCQHLQSHRTSVR
jgi:hypothetical protein